MGVYIKNMEMPRSCWDCELGSAQQLDGSPCPFYSADYREQKKYSDKRADGCPLVPVPPHGDLIDRDAYAYPGDLVDEPVIIPAEPTEVGE